MPGSGIGMILDLKPNNYNRVTRCMYMAAGMGLPYCILITALCDKSLESCRAKLWIVLGLFILLHIAHEIILWAFWGRTWYKKKKLLAVS